MNPLPAGWYWSTVGEVGRVDLGRQRHPDWHTGPEMRPYLRVANVFEDRIDTSDVKMMDFSGVFERYKLEPGDVLLNEGQSPEFLGRPAIYRGLPENVAFTNTLLRFRAGSHVLPEWALAVFRRHMHARRFAREARITTNIAHLSANRLKPVEFPVPPLDEQRRIVDILEDHLSRLDAAVGTVKLAARRFTGLELSLLSDLRRRLPTEASRLAPLRSFCDTSLGKMLDAKRAHGEPSPYLRNVNVRWRSFDLSDVKYVALTNTERERFNLLPGDIIVCEGGEPGRCAVWPEGQAAMAYQKALHRVRVRDRSVALPDFVALMIEEYIRSGKATTLFTGTTIKHLPQEKLRLIELPLPDLEQQRSIASRFHEFVRESQRLTGSVRISLQRAEALRRALLEAAFTGRLTGRASDMDRVEEMAGV